MVHDSLSPNAVDGFEDAPANLQEQPTEGHGRVSQEIPGPRIDLSKLSTKLKSKFGPTAYQIQLMHDVLRINAPGRLSSVCNPPGGFGQVLAIDI